MSQTWVYFTYVVFTVDAVLGRKINGVGPPLLHRIAGVVFVVCSGVDWLVDSWWFATLVALPLMLVMSLLVGIESEERFGVVWVWMDHVPLTARWFHSPVWYVMWTLALAMLRFLFFQLKSTVDQSRAEGVKGESDGSDKPADASSVGDDRYSAEWHLLW